MSLALVVIACSMPSRADQPTPPEAGATGEGPDSIQPPGAQTVPPEFPYTGQGETLALIQEVESGQPRIVLLDPVGLGFREIRLPEGVTMPDPPEAGLSPDGAYYAYFTGSTENGDLTLVVYSLDDKSPLIEIELLSSDFPDNFQQLADEFIQSGNIPEDLSSLNPEEIPVQLQYAFEYGIHALAWAPHGRNLAFSGQMNGPSSDLYVLDSQTLRITQLTTGSSMMQRLSWSPDGHWIMHGSAYYVGMGSNITNHAASRDGSGVNSFPPNMGLEEGLWLTTNLYTANQGENGPGSFDLMVFDARFGSVRTIFEGAFQTYAFDPRSNSILLQSYAFFDTDREQSLYRIEANEPYEITPISAPDVYSLHYIGLEGYPFSGLLDDGGMVIIGPDGSMRSLDDRIWFPTPAPTANLLALSYFQSDAGVWIYNVERDQRTDVYSGSVYGVEWRPDSGAFFYLTDHELHVYTLDNQEHMLIYAWPGSPVSRTRFAWVTLP
jgi:hypothetical protein